MNLINMKNIKKLIALGLIMGTFTQIIYASDLNGIGAENEDKIESNIEVIIDTEVEKETGQVEENKSTEGNLIPNFEGLNEESKVKMEDTAKAVGDMFGNAGIDEESINQANNYIRPFASILNKIMAGILGLTSILMMFVTVLDLVYIGVPITRDLLDGGSQGSQQAQQGGESMGGRYGGMSGRYGGMGSMGGSFGSGVGGISQPQQQQAPGGGLSAVGRFISDEAQAAVLDAQGGPMGASTMGGSVKTVIGAYIKKRSFFLIMFGVCVVLFTSTVFTDLGIKLGMWLLRLLMGIG